MKVDWTNADFVMRFSDMSPPGGQFVQAVPLSLGRVAANASIHIDKDDGTRYVHVGGFLNPPSPLPDPRPSVETYWPYEWAGWPVIAAIPGDIFNAQTSASDPDYEYGGKYIESGMLAKLDPDASGPWLQSYNSRTGLFEDQLYTPLGNSGAGGIGEEGRTADGTLKSGWIFRAVSQRCWVLIVVDPSGHRVYDTIVAAIDGKPIILNPQRGQSLRFGLYWRLGAGSNIPGLATGGVFSGKPSSVQIG